MTSPVSWYADPAVPGSRVGVLYTGTQVHLVTADIGSPPGCDDPDPLGQKVSWCRLVGDDWPWTGWFLLDTRPDLSSWVTELSRSGGTVPDRLQAIYWRAYAHQLLQLVPRQEDPW